MSEQFVELFYVRHELPALDKVSLLLICVGDHICDLE